MSYDASGMLSDPLDPNAPRTRKRDYPVVVARCGVVVEDRTTGVVGALVSFAPPRLVLRDRYGKDHTVRYADGSVRADIDNKGVPCKLVLPKTEPEGPKITASGSIDAGDVPARVARASRIWVEGVHDAELIEKVWGADLRVEGVVVEQLEGADDLAERVRGFRPGDRRRLGQRPVRWPNPSTTPAAWSSSRHWPASVRPTGMRGLAARSSASPEALAGPNSFGPRSRPWPTKLAMSSTP